MARGAGEEPRTCRGSSTVRLRFARCGAQEEESSVSTFRHKAATAAGSKESGGESRQYRSSATQGMHTRAVEEDGAGSGSEGRRTSSSRSIGAAGKDEFVGSKRETRLAAAAAADLCLPLSPFRFYDRRHCRRRRDPRSPSLARSLARSLAQFVFTKWGSFLPCVNRERTTTVGRTDGRTSRATLRVTPLVSRGGCAVPRWTRYERLRSFPPRPCTL